MPAVATVDPHFADRGLRGGDLVDQVASATKSAAGCRRRDEAELHRVEGHLELLDPRHPGRLGSFTVACPRLIGRRSRPALRRAEDRRRGVVDGFGLLGWAAPVEWASGARIFAPARRSVEWPLCAAMRAGAPGMASVMQVLREVAALHRAVRASAGRIHASSSVPSRTAVQGLPRGSLRRAPPSGQVRLPGPWWRPCGCGSVPAGTCRRPATVRTTQSGRQPPTGPGRCRCVAPSWSRTLPPGQARVVEVVSFGGVTTTEVALNSVPLPAFTAGR